MYVPGPNTRTLCRSLQNTLVSCWNRDSREPQRGQVPHPGTVSVRDHLTVLGPSWKLQAVLRCPNPFMIDNMDVSAESRVRPMNRKPDIGRYKYPYKQKADLAIYTSVALELLHVAQSESFVTHQHHDGPEVHY